MSTKHTTPPPTVKLISSQDITAGHLHKQMQQQSLGLPIWVENTGGDFSAEMATLRRLGDQRALEPYRLSGAFVPNKKYGTFYRYERKDEPIGPYYRTLLAGHAVNATALVIRLEQLSDLKQVLPFVNVRHFESTHDFFSHTFARYEFEYMDEFHLTNRTWYDNYLNLCNDRDLWADKQPISARANVDVIIHTDTPAWPALAALASRMWNGSDDRPVSRPGAWMKWRIPGNRTETPQTHDPAVVLSDYGQETYTFPVQERTTAEQLERAGQSAEYYQQLGEYLQKHAGGCGWFTGSFQFQYLAFQDPGDGPNLLVRPGTEHEHVLPMSNEQLLQRIDSGDVASGKVVIHSVLDFHQFAKFRDGLEASYKTVDPSLSYDEATTQLFARPETEEVVFYCNKAIQTSPLAAEQHVKWMKEHHPERRQRVYVLQGGMASMRDHLEKMGKVGEYLKWVLLEEHYQYFKTNVAFI